MKSFAFVMARLCAVLILPVIFFILALDTKKKELTDIEVSPTTDRL